MADCTDNPGEGNQQRNNLIATRLLKVNAHVAKTGKRYHSLMKAAASIRKCGKNRLVKGKALECLDDISPGYQKQVPSCCLLFG